MTRDQYTELACFLGRKFDGIDRRLEETRRHATVLFERSEANLIVVAKGLGVRLERVEGRIQVLEGVRPALED